MQARLSFRQFPSTIVAVAFALIAALVLGGVLGYTLKSPITRYVVVTETGSGGAPQDQCIWVNHNKAC